MYIHIHNTHGSILYLYGSIHYRWFDLLFFSLSNPWGRLHNINIHRLNCFLKQEEVTLYDSLVITIKTLCYEMNRDQMHTYREGRNVRPMIFCFSSLSKIIQWRLKFETNLCRCTSGPSRHSDQVCASVDCVGRKI